jgi:hypothetical protein
MFSLRRQFASALQHSSSGRVAQSLPARLSSTISAAEVTVQEYEALTIPPIFDIFDAPVRLGESSALAGRTATTTRNVVPECDGEKSQNIVSDVTGARYFSSLPPPIVFDGPARPAHLLPRALENRRKMRQRLSLSPNREAHPLSSFTSPSEPVYEVFDGPSRITHYKYPTASSEVLQTIISEVVTCLLVSLLVFVTAICLSGSGSLWSLWLAGIEGQAGQPATVGEQSISISRHENLSHRNYPSLPRSFSSLKQASLCAKICTQIWSWPAHGECGFVA